MAKRINYASMFTQRKDGRYQASYTDATGRHYLYDRAPEVLYQKLQAAQLPQEEHIPTFREIAESWERTHREEIEQRTWNNYRPHLIEILSRHGDKPISEVGALDVSNHLTFAKAADYSATVVNTIRSIYRMIFDHAICSGAAQYNPVTSVRLPRSLKKGKRTAPSDDIVKIICQNLDSPFGFFPFFLLCTGLRKSEALALTWDDIDFSSNTISITNSMGIPPLVFKRPFCPIRRSPVPKQDKNFVKTVKNCQGLSPLAELLRQHRIMGQGDLARDFDPAESSGNAGILCVFPIFVSCTDGAKGPPKPAAPIVRCCLNLSGKCPECFCPRRRPRCRPGVCRRCRPKCRPKFCPLPGPRCP